MKRSQKKLQDAGGTICLGSFTDLYKLFRREPARRLQCCCCDHILIMIEYFHKAVAICKALAFEVKAVVTLQRTVEHDIRIPPEKAAPSVVHGGTTGASSCKVAGVFSCLLRARIVEAYDPFPADVAARNTFHFTYTMLRFSLVFHVLFTATKKSVPGRFLRSIVFQSPISPVADARPT
ncbi:MAG: hypothetical protein HDQ87_09620 [Clostridia bacterium]|nr:hypothetical protein [Clostridia bacterium]